MKTTNKLLTSNLFTEVYRTRKEDMSKTRVKIMQQLIDEGASMTDSTIFGHSPLVEAVEHGLINVLKLFVKNNVNINATVGGIYENQGFSATPIYIGAKYGCYDSVKFLLDNKAIMTINPPSPLSPLHIACINGHIEVVQLFIAHGANPTEEDLRYHKTTFDWAKAKGHTDILNYLQQLQHHSDEENIDFRLPLPATADTGNEVMITGQDIIESSDD